MTPLEVFAFILLPLALPALGWVAVRRYECALDRQIAEEAASAHRLTTRAAPRSHAGSPAHP